MIIGLDSITGLQAARLLTERGIGVVGIAHDRGHFACRTRLCERIVTAPPGGQALVAVLERLATMFPQRAMLLPCTDLAVAAVSEHRQRLEATYAFRLPAHDVVMRLMDKASFAELAEEHAIPVPRTVVLRERRDVERAVDLLTFPVVLKPALKPRDWQARAGAKVLQARDADEMVALYERFGDAAGTLVGQEWLPGDDDELFTCNAYFTEGGVPAATFVSRKLRQWPQNGTGCLAVEVRNEEVLELTGRLFSAVGFVGLAYLEVKHDPRTGRYLVIEPNVGRPTGRSAAAELSGVELLMSAYRHSLDLPLPPERSQGYRGTKWIYLRHDLQSSVQAWRHGRLRPVGWARSLAGVRADAVWATRDPLPFAADLLQAARKAIRRHRFAGVP